MPSSNTHDDKARSKVFLGPNDTQEAFLDESKGNFQLAEKPQKANKSNNGSNSTVFLGPEEVRERKLKDMSSDLKYSESSKAINHQKKLHDTNESTVFLGAHKTQEASLSEIESSIHYAEKKKTSTRATQATIENASTTTVFLGPQDTRESTLDNLADNLKWTEKAKDEYLKRVKEKATLGVKSLLINAQKKADAIVEQGRKDVEIIQKDTKELNAKALTLADESAKAHEEAKNTLAEAENIKNSAYEEGYNAGLHQAQLQLEEAKKEISKSVSAILLSIHEQCITIFNSWREDLVSLLNEAVETSTGYILETEKKALLKNVLESSVNALLNKREYQVRANPNDALLLTEILENMQDNLRQNQNWNLVTDEQVAEGSVVVESPSGVIKNTTETREGLVRQILDQLTLPLSDGDQIAYDAISQTLIEEAQKANIPLHAEEETEEIAKENIAQSSQEAEVSPLTQNEQPAPISPPSEGLSQQSATIPSEHEILAQNTNKFDESEVFANNNSVHEDIMQAREALIKETQEIQAQNEEKTKPAEPIISAEEQAENLANELVEKELDFDALNGFIASDIPPEADKSTQEKSKNNKADKPEYTPELADELLNEMGF